MRRLLANLFGGRAWRYGPNSTQVERFLQLARTLTPEQWEQVQNRASTNAIEQLDHEDMIARVGVFKARHGERRANAWLDAARDGVDDIAFDTRKSEWSGKMGGDTYSAAGLVATVLVLRQFLTPHQFDACYAPFEGVIPLDSLGPGKTPRA